MVILILHIQLNNIYKPTASCNGTLLKILDDFIIHLNLNQIVHKPTHTNGNILDFLLTNNPDAIFDYTTTHTIHSDHFFVDVTTHLNFTKAEKADTQRFFNSKFDEYNLHNEAINWEYINKNFEDTDWHDILQPFESDPENQYNVLIKTTEKISQQHD